MTAATGTWKRDRIEPRHEPMIPHATPLLRHGADAQPHSHLALVLAFTRKCNITYYYSVIIPDMQSKNYNHENVVKA